MYEKKEGAKQVSSFFYQLIELLSGKNLNSDAHLQVSNYIFNMLALLDARKIKDGSIKLLRDNNSSTRR
ncbi:hypothetical protein [Bacillus cereus]|uniref:hypothetical protein n=1 Tax=Bacillus cereus TaxID=1396 RepID=UPI0018A1ABFB|nr:hypothetical protein [Bacillus cereus]